MRGARPHVPVPKPETLWLSGLELLDVTPEINFVNVGERCNVAVVIEASHMCMQMRGIEKQQSATTTSAFTGVFLSSQRTREEFMTLISHRYR